MQVVVINMYFLFYCAKEITPISHLVMLLHAMSITIHKINIFEPV
jgi:hypothetical protein